VVKFDLLLGWSGINDLVVEVGLMFRLADRKSL
jgi:hypothetical protein